MTPSRSGRFVLSIAGALLALCGMAPASAEILIQKPTTTGTVSFAERNDQQFRTGFRIGLDIDPGRMDRELVRKSVDSLPLTLPDGQTLRARDFSTEHRVIVGTVLPGVTPNINRVDANGGATELLVGFRDRDGNFVKPEERNIGAFTLDGIPVPHQVTPFDRSRRKVYVDLLLDRSGSMKDLIGDVKRAAAEFMVLLPKDQALCRVTSFNQDHHRHTRDFQPCIPIFHGVGSIPAGGGTDIYDPLLEAYVNGPADRNAQRLVVVISDGIGQSSFTRQALLNNKTAATTVYWLGDYDEDRLRGIADTFIYGRQDIAGLLERTLGHVADAVGSQVVITIGNQGGKP